MNALRIQPGKGFNGGRLLVFEELSSTNTWVLEHEPELAVGDAVQALRQTAGRGRFARRWVSDASALTLTLLLHPDTCPGLPAHSLGQTAALALCEALDGLHCTTGIKWPNDVLSNGRKIAGILLEQTPAGRIALGLGLNVNSAPADLPAQPAGTGASSILLVTGQPADRDDVRARFLRCLASRFEHYRSNPARFPTDYADRDVLRGRDVTVTDTQGTHAGRAEGIDAEGRLRLRLPDGSIRFMWSGDATLA